MLNPREHFVQGFVKRAKDHGFTLEDLNPILQHMLTRVPFGLAVGAASSPLLMHLHNAKLPEDGTKLTFKDALKKGLIIGGAGGALRALTRGSAEMMAEDFQEYEKEKAEKEESHKPRYTPPPHPRPLYNLNDPNYVAPPLPSPFKDFSLDK